MITKPLNFKGSHPDVDFATSAPGGVRIEVQDVTGAPIPGFALDDCAS